MMINRIAEEFAHYFQHWEITLPPEVLKSRHPGDIHQQGWTIQYLFGSDEEGEYLDFYATHRRANDRHVRVYSSGKIKHLPSYLEFIVYPANATQAQRARAEREYFEYNRAVSEVLKRKGFE